MKKNHFAGKALACVLSLSMIAGIVSAAEWDLTHGSIHVNAEKDQNGTVVHTVTQNDSSTVDNDVTITSHGNETGHTITIQTKGDAVADVTLKNVNIKTIYEGSNPIEANDANVTLHLEGKNTAKNYGGSGSQVGVHTGTNGNMTITSSETDSDQGTLNAYGLQGAAIGTDANETFNGSITIDGTAKITAETANGNAVGCGQSATMTENSSITIGKDATVVGKSSTSTGIGANTMNGTISISGTATGASRFTNGIGSAVSGNGQIQILGNAQVQSKQADDYLHYEGRPDAPISLKRTDPDNIHNQNDNPEKGKIDYILSTGATINGQAVTDAASTGHTIGYDVDANGNPLNVQTVDPDYVPPKKPNGQDPEPTPGTDPKAPVAGSAAEEETPSKAGANPGYWITSNSNAIPFTKNADGSVLTIEVAYADAEFCSNGAGVDLLLAQGIETVVFKTSAAAATIDLTAASQAMEAWTALKLICRDTKADLTLDGADAAAYLK